MEIRVSDSVLDDLRRRLSATRWPDEVPGLGWRQGAPLPWVQRLVAYWAEEFDWRAWEARLNELEHVMWEGIHFVHHRGGGIPLVLTHGWPSTFLDYLPVLPLLKDFDVVIPSLPGYGFSPRPPRVGVNYRYVSDRWHALMTHLGYERFGAAGGDFGAGVATFLALDHPESLIGIHLTTPELEPEVDDAELSDVERAYVEVVRGWDKAERGYSAIQSTKPLTVGYGLHDSPAGLAAYLGEKWYSWTEVTPSDDFLCATLTLYWVTGSITSSMRDYWDNRWYPVEPSFVDVPTAFGVFAHSKVDEGEPPRSYLERLYNVQRWTVFPHGGHFAPVECPSEVAGDLKAFFVG